MSYYYTPKIQISHEDFAVDLSERGIHVVSEFLSELTKQLSIRYTSEDGSPAVIPEDVYFETILQSINDGLKLAQERHKIATKKAFAQPTREQVESHIADLMKKRAERLEKEAAATVEDEKAKRIDSLLPEPSEEEKEFMTLFSTFPVQTLSYDFPFGTSLVIKFKDGRVQSLACDADKYNRILNYWDRWNDSKSLKNLKAVGADIKPGEFVGGNPFSGSRVVEPFTTGPNSTYIKKTVDTLVDNMMKQQAQHQKDLAAKSK